MLLEMRRQLFNFGRENRDLHFRRTGIVFVRFEFFDNAIFFFFGEHGCCVMRIILVKGHRPLAKMNAS